MAKQIVNPFERHVEKALLAVAGVALIGVVVMYVVTSPNTVEIDGQQVTPSDIGTKLAQKAADVRQRLRSFRPEEKEPEKLAERFAEARERFAAAQLAAALPRAARIGPEVPFVDPKGATPGQAQLVKVLKLDPPSVQNGRSTFVLEDTGLYQAANWVTVSALINREEQSKVQALEYGSQRAEVIFGPPQVQRRAMHSDGTWSDEDWADITPWPAAKLPTPPTIEFEEEEGRQVVPRTVVQAVVAYQDDVNVPQLQMELLRPLFPTVSNGDRWKLPSTVPCIEILRMDDDYFNRNVVDRTADSALDDRYQQCTVAVAPQVAADEGIAAILAQADKLHATAKQTNNQVDATRAYNMYVDVSLDKTATPAQVAQAKRGMAVADQTIRDIKRLQRRGGAAPVNVQPEQQQRQLQPKQLAWAHDALPSSVGSGKVYEYRMRATLFNRLAAQPSKFEDPEDAKVVFISGEWSEPSEPVVVPPTTEFYVTGVDARKMIAKIEIYQWFEGYWVTTRENFEVGNRIAVTDRVQLPALDEPDVIDRPQVAFDTGYTLLRVLPEREFRDKKGRGSGIRFQDALTKEEAAVFVDSEGNVVERFVPTDKGSPEKKELASRVWRPSRKGP